tara:strand:- start:78 stop:317 length:240 start_codon:yes stop_codon:yes gene_type:complete
MKIKVKRYKQIEQIAMLEAVEKVLLENLELGGQQFKTAIQTLKDAGLSEELLDGVEKAVAQAAAAVVAGDNVTVMEGEE